MKTVNIRELTHHFASYLKVIRRGERVVVVERNLPVADMVPHHDHPISPAWKRPIRRIRVSGEPLSKTVIRMRAYE